MQATEGKREVTRSYLIHSECQKREVVEMHQKRVIEALTFGVVLTQFEAEQTGDPHHNRQR
jgi:hypothetical protein